MNDSCVRVTASLSVKEIHNPLGMGRPELLQLEYRWLPKTKLDILQEQKHKLDIPSSTKKKELQMWSVLKTPGHKKICKYVWCIKYMSLETPGCTFSRMSAHYGYVMTDKKCLLAEYIRIILNDQMGHNQLFDVCKQVDEEKKKKEKKKGGNNACVQAATIYVQLTKSADGILALSGFIRKSAGRLVGNLSLSHTHTACYIFNPNTIFF